MLTEKNKKISHTFFPRLNFIPLFSTLYPHQLHSGKENRGCGHAASASSPPEEDSSHSFPAPLWGPTHTRQSFMDFSKRNPSQGLHLTHGPSMSPFHGVQDLSLGPGCQWFPWIWGKLWKPCHRIHPCLAPTTKTLPQKPNTCGVAALIRLTIYLQEMVHCARDKLYFCLVTIKVSSFITKPQNCPSRKEILEWQLKGHYLRNKVAEHSSVWFSSTSVCCVIKLAQISPNWFSVKCAWYVSHYSPHEYYFCTTLSPFSFASQ